MQMDKTLLWFSLDYFNVRQRSELQKQDVGLRNKVIGLAWRGGDHSTKK